MSETKYGAAVDKAIRLAWGCVDITHQGARPTPQQALNILKNHNPGYNWLSGAEAIKVLTDCLSRPLVFTPHELLTVTDEDGVTPAGEPSGQSAEAHAAHAAINQLLESWPDLFTDGHSTEAFNADVEEVIEHLRQWADAVVVHVNQRRSEVSQPPSPTGQESKRAA